MYTGKLITENNAIGALDGALSAVSTSMVLQSVAGFPDVSVAGDFCVLTLIRASDGAIEYVKCTDFNAPTRTYTIERAQEGTIALAFVDGDEVRDLLTRDQIEYLRTQDGSNSILKDGSVAFTGDVDMGGNVVTNGADAVNPTDLVTKQQTEALIASSSDGTVLTTIDMTNGGANDLNNIDINWQASWDTYDYVEIRVTRCKMNNAGLMGFALSADGGTTWKSLYDKTKEAVFWTDTPTIVQTQETRSFTVRINLQEDNKMLHFYDMVASRYTTDEVNLGDNVTVQGFEFDYSGTTLTNKVGILTSAGWQTNSLGLNGYMLRFTHEVGNFVNGTLKIIGYDYP
jgi:hypothetical protein